MNNIYHTIKKTFKNMFFYKKILDIQKNPGKCIMSHNGELCTLIERKPQCTKLN